MARHRSSTSSRGPSTSDDGSGESQGRRELVLLMAPGAAPIGLAGNLEGMSDAVEPPLAEALGQAGATIQPLFSAPPAAARPASSALEGMADDLAPDAEL